MNRIDWIDNLKGIGIFLVVWGHTMSVPQDAKRIIYSCHMALFFAISGFLFKKKEINLGYLKQLFKKFIVPYILFSVLSFFFSIFLDKLNGTSFSLLAKFKDLFCINGSVGWNSPLWFLLILLMVEISYQLIAKCKVNLFFLPALLTIIVYFATAQGERWHFGLNIVPYGLVFYQLGYYIRRTDILELLNPIRIKLPVLLGLLTLSVFSAFNNIRVSIYANEIGSLFFFLLSSICGTLFMFLITYKTPKSKMLRFYGKNTLFIMCTHYFLIGIIEVVNKRVPLPFLTTWSNYRASLLLLILIFLVYIPLIKFYNRMTVASQIKA